MTKPTQAATPVQPISENIILPFEAQNRKEETSEKGALAIKTKDSANLLEASSSEDGAAEEVIPIETRRETELTVRSETFNPTPNQKSN